MKQMSIDGYITLVVSEEQIEPARLLMQALDPDVGGYHSFGPVTEDGLYVCSMPADSEKIELFEVLQENPKKMAEFIAMEQEKRFKPSAELMDKLDAQLTKQLKAVTELELVNLKAEMLVAKEHSKELEKTIQLNTKPREKLIESDLGTVKEIVIKG